MKITDTKSLLKEKAETIIDEMLDEMEEPTSEKEPEEVAAPEAEVKKDVEAEHVGEGEELEPVEGKENEESPKGVVSGVEKDLESDHAAEGEEVAEVVVKEESVEKSLEDDHIGEDSELEPEEGKENEEAEHEDEKAVAADLEAEHVGEGEELEPVEGKENEEAPAADKKEVEASLEADHAEEDTDVEGVVVKEDEDLELELEDLEEEEISEDTLETDPAAEEAKEEYGEVAKDADIGKAEEEGKAEETVEKVDELLKDEPISEPEEEKKDDELLEGSMKTIFDLINTINESLMPESTEDKEPKEASPAEAAKEIEAKAEDEEAAEGEEVKEVVVTEAPVVADEDTGENKHWQDERIDLRKVPSATHEVRDGIKVVHGHTMDGKVYVQGETKKDEEKLKAKTAEQGITEEAEKAFDVDAVITTPEVAEMGTEENEKHIENVEDGKCPCGEHKAGECECKPEAKSLKESAHYTSLKEACMLDEEYFTTDTYIVESADAKQAKLANQVALLMARESGDPLYEELITAAVRFERLQEAVVNKYHDEAVEKTGTIIENIKK